MVAVDVLPQEGDFLDSVSLQYLNFLQYSVHISTSFPSSDKGNNAEGAHVVAPSHN